MEIVDLLVFPRRDNAPLRRPQGLARAPAESSWPPIQSDQSLDYEVVRRAVTERNNEKDWAIIDATICRIASAILGYSSPDVKDARQAAALHIFRGFRRFKDDGDPLSIRRWVNAVARNATIDVLRVRARDVELFGDDAEADGEHCGAHDAEHIESFADTRHLREAFEALPIGFRLVLVMHHFEGLKNKVIADTLGISEVTVRTRLARAIKLIVMYNAGKGSTAETIATVPLTQRRFA